MAVAFDAVGPGATGTTGASSPLTWTHVCGGSATHLLVGATWDGSPDGSGTMSATYNSVSMTSLGVWHCGGGTAGFLQVWSLASPATGSHSVSVTAGGSPGGLNAGSISFTGSSGLSAVQSAVSAGASTNPTLAFTGSVSGNVVAAFVGGGSPQTPSGSFTSRYNENSGSGQQGAGYTAGSTIASPGGSTTASWTMNSDFWAVAAVEVQAGAAYDGSPAASWQQPWAPALAAVFGPGAPFTARGFSLDPAPSLSVSAGVATASAVAPPAGAPRAVIAGLGGTGAGFFADQGGNPRFVLGDAVWGLPGNGGRWSSGAWQSDFDTYFATRAGQGFTVAYTKPMGTTQNAGINDDGRTFDGLFPFQGGSLANPSTGLTSSYWARFDYFLNSALAQGITVFCNAIGYDSDFETSGPLAGKSAGEFQSYGAAIGARYASQPNLIWMVADDYFGAVDTKISSFLTGLRGAGANQPISIENFPESTSRADVTSGASTPWGASNAQFQFTYSYNVTYYGIEKAYLESSPITVIQGDGYFYQGNSTYAGGSGAFAYDRAIRQDAWHAISSGARGIIHGDEACWQWASTAQAAAAANWYQVHNAGNIRTLMESLPNWQLLIPDTSSLLVTAGRGTHATGFTSGGGGGQYEVAFTDSYVTASRTAAGDLAVIYLSHATSITIDQSKMVGSYQAFWVDPITGAKTSTTTGTTYNSATPGNNSQGDPDWVLVLQAPGSAVTASAGVAAASAVANAPVVAVTVTAAAAAAAGAAPAPAHAAAAIPSAPAAAGAAPGPLAAVTVTAAVAPSAGVANAATVSTSSATNAPAGVAAASAVALAAQASEGVSAAAAAGSAIASPPSASVAPAASVATASAVSLAPKAAAVTLAGPAAGTGTALAPVPAAGVISAVAPASAVALAATVNTSGSTNAVAAVAASSGAALAPLTAITSAAGVAAGTALAPAPVPAAAVLPAAGTAHAIALAAAVTLGNATNANAGVATSSALALAPATAVTLTAGAASAAATALAAVTPPPFTVGTLTAAAASSATLTAGTQRTGGPS